MKISVGSRYSSLELIPWWNIQTLKDARALVVGAGALGNEVLKTLALLGLKQILIVDFDNIENSNLSRAVLFREADVGRPKAEVAAQRVQELNPEILAQYAHGSVQSRIGAGVFRHVDLVFGCVDNLEARISINAHCYAVEKVWFDAGIDVLTGEVRTFIPDGQNACFECGLADEDYLLVNLRYSCAQLLRDSLIKGKQPTTPIVASIVSAIQVQQAIRYLHKFEIHPGIIHYDGFDHFIHKSERRFREDCLAHNRFMPIVECSDMNQGTRLRQLLEVAQEYLGPEAVLEFDRELLLTFKCNHCNNIKPIYRPIKQVAEIEALCPICGHAMRSTTCRKANSCEDILEKTLHEIGFPPLHIYRAYTSLNEVYLEVTGDARTLFNVAGEWYGSY